MHSFAVAQYSLHAGAINSGSIPAQQAVYSGSIPAQQIVYSGGIPALQAVYSGGIPVLRAVYSSSIPAEAAAAELPVSVSLHEMLPIRAKPQLHLNYCTKRVIASGVCEQTLSFIMRV